MDNNCLAHTIWEGKYHIVFATQIKHYKIAIVFGVYQNNTSPKYLSCGTVKHFSIDFQ